VDVSVLGEEGEIGLLQAMKDTADELTKIRKELAKLNNEIRLTREEPIMAIGYMIADFIEYIKKEGLKWRAR